MCGGDEFHGIVVLEELYTTNLGFVVLASELKVCVVKVINLC